MIPAGWESNQFNLFLEKINWGDIYILIKSSLQCYFLCSLAETTETYCYQPGRTSLKNMSFAFKIQVLIQPKIMHSTYVLFKMWNSVLYHTLFPMDQFLVRNVVAYSSFLMHSITRQSWEFKLLITSFNNNCLPPPTLKVINRFWGNL